MKRFNFLALAAATILSAGLFSCTNTAGGDEGDKPYFDLENLPNDLQGMVPLDLGEHGLPLVMLVPDTNKGYPDITVHGYGETEVKVGRAFWVKIAEGNEMELKKEDIEQNLLYESEFLDQNDSSLLYKYWFKDDPNRVQHHFYLVRTINGIEYEISDVDAIEVSERAARSMLESAKMIVPRRPDPAPAGA